MRGIIPLIIRSSFTARTSSVRIRISSARCTTSREPRQQVGNATFQLFQPRSSFLSFPITGCSSIRIWTGLSEIALLFGFFAARTRPSSRTPQLLFSAPQTSLCSSALSFRFPVVFVFRCPAAAALRFTRLAALWRFLFGRSFVVILAFLGIV